MDELEENYQKLKDVSYNEDFEIIIPAVLPDVEASTKAWFGYYIDEYGEIQHIILQENKCMTTLSANDERANEIYRWYVGK